jgi:hypothetical protein
MALIRKERKGAALIRKVQKDMASPLKEMKGTAFEGLTEPRLLVCRKRRTIALQPEKPLMELRSC